MYYNNIFISRLMTSLKILIMGFLVIPLHDWVKKNINSLCSNQEPGNTVVAAIRSYIKIRLAK